ncbi:hypothetical protein [Nonomuraea dietziae]|uniref:hypothetical protein n=1 Tax=Nonomuraea dietziae TaxID=65515 RepID=UPI0031D18296
MAPVRLAPRIKTRRALVFLDGEPSRRLAHALRLCGFDVRTGEADVPAPALTLFLTSAEPGELLLVRWPSGATWTPTAFTALIAEFSRRLGDSAAAALLLVVDFGWVLHSGPDEPDEAVLDVPGDPPVAAAALTASLTGGAGPPQVRAPADLAAGRGPAVQARERDRRRPVRPGEGELRGAGLGPSRDHVQARRHRGRGRQRGPYRGRGRAGRDGGAAQGRGRARGARVGGRDRLPRPRSPSRRARQAAAAPDGTAGRGRAAERGARRTARRPRGAGGAARVGARARSAPRGARVRQVAAVV